MEGCVALSRCDPPMTPEEEQRKAEKAKTIIYVLMAIFIILPFILLYFIRFR